jgi:ankyrin repeat protein/chromosome segregation ATPase
MVNLENREPVRVYLRIRPELEDDGTKNGTGEALGSSSTSKECLSVIEGGTTVRVNPMTSFTQSGMSRKGREGTGSASTNSMDNRMFTFDRVFPDSTSQEELYKHVSAHVNATVRGYNTTIFAYGSTGSGKTHTMTGCAAAPGIIPRAISEIFSIIEATAAREKDVFFYVRMSYVELYNNNFRNLLDFASKERQAALENSAREAAAAAAEEEEGTERDGSSGGHNDKDSTRDGGSTVATDFSTHSPSFMHPGLSKRTDKIEVRESKSAGIFLAGPNLRLPVTTAQEAFSLINKGNKVRATAATKCNDFSSRSHAILTLHVESKVHVADLAAAGADDDTDATESASASASASASSSKKDAQKPELRLGKMHLVDLAGSERISLSGAEGGTLLETQSINSSLTAIGDVLAALSRNATIAQKQLEAQAAAEAENAANGGGKRASKHAAAGKSDAALFPMVPIPYRNSKLTHLLKDSLGGNSKTIMIATVRNFSDHYQQTVVSLMYASRAKKVKNRSILNRNVMGDTGIQTVNTEIELLRTRLDERSLEFDRLRNLHLQDVQEKSELKSRLAQLHAINEAEKAELESKMSTIVHSQAGQIATQRQKINVLQIGLKGELAQAKQEVTQKTEEIKWLKEALERSNEAADNAVDPDEVAHLKNAAQQWKEQSENLGQELAMFKQENGLLRKQNNCYAEEIGKMLESKNRVLDDILSRRKDGERLVKALQYKEREAAQAAEKGQQVRHELEEVASRYHALSSVVVEQEEQLGRQKSLLDGLEAGMKQVVEAKDTQLASLKAQKETLMGENKRLEGECEELKTKVTTTLASLQQSALGAVEETARKLTASSAQLEQERTKLSELKKQSAALMGELAASKQEQEASINTAKKAHAALESTTAALEEAQTRAKKSEEEEKALSATFTTYLESCVTKMNDMHERHNSLQAELEGELRALKARISEHESEDGDTSNGGGGQPVMIKLRAMYEERERNHREHHHQQLQRVHAYLGEVEENLREKLSETILSTSRTLTSKQLEYFSVILARIQKRHKAKLETAVAARTELEARCGELERELHCVETTLADASAEREQEGMEAAERISAAQEELRRHLARTVDMEKAHAEALRALQDELATDAGVAQQQAIDALEQKHQDDRAMLLAEHSMAMQAVQQSVTGLEQQLVASQQALLQSEAKLAAAEARAVEAEDSSRLETEHRRELESLRTVHTEEMAQHEATCASLNSRLEDATAELEKSRDMHEKQLQQLRTAHEAEVAAAVSEAQSEADAALTRQKTSLADEYARTVQEISDAHAATLATKESSHSVILADQQQELVRIREEHAAELSRSQEEAKEELSRWVGTYTAQLDSLESQSATERTEALATLKASLEEESQQRLLAAEEEHSVVLGEERERSVSLQSALEVQQQSFERARAAAKEEASAAHAALQTRLNEVLSEQVAAERKVATLSEQLSAHLHEREALHESLEQEKERMQALQDAHAEQLTALRANLVEQVKSTQDKYRDDLSALEKSSGADLESALTAQKASLEATAAEALEALEGKLAERAQQNEEHQARIAELESARTELQGRVDAAERVLGLLKDEAEALGAKLSLAEARADTSDDRVAELEAEVASVQEQGAASSAAHAQAMADLEASLGQARADLEQLAAQKADADVKLAALKDESETNLAAQKADADAKLAALKDESETDLAAQKADADAKLADVNAKLAAQKAAADTKLATVESLGASRAEQMLAALAVVNGEKERLQVTLKGVEAEKEEATVRCKDLEAALTAAKTHATATETALRETVAATEREARAGAEKCAELESSVAALKDRESVLRQLASDLQQKAGLNRSEAQERVEELSVQLDTEQARSGQLTSQLQGLRASLTKETLRADSLQSVLAATNEGHMTERLDLTERLNDAARKYTALETRMEEHREGADHRVRTLQSEVRGLESEKSNLSLELRKQRDQHAEKDSRMGQLVSGSEATLETLRQELLRQQAAHVATLQKNHKLQLERTQEAHAEAEAELQSQARDLTARLEQRDRQLDAASEGHQRELGRREQELLALAKDEAAAAARRLEDATAELEKSRDMHEKQLQQLRTAHEAEVAAAVSEAQSEADAALTRQKISQADQQRRALETQEQDLRAEQEQAVATALAKQDVRITELSGEHKRVEGQKASLVQELGTLHTSYKAQIDTLHTAAEAATAEHSRVVRGLEEALRAARAHAEEASDAGASVAIERDSAVSGLQRRLEQAQTQAQVAEEQLSVLQTQNRQFEVQLSDMQDKHAVARAQGEARASELVLSLQSSRDECRTLTSKLDALGADHQEASSRGDELHSKHQLQQAQVHALTAALKLEQSRAADVDKAKEDTDMQLHQLQIKLAETEGALADTQAREREIERDRVATLSRVQEEVESLRAQLAQQREAHDRASHELSSKIASLGEAAARDRLGYEETVRGMESGYQQQLASALAQQEKEHSTHAAIELTTLQKKHARLEWQYEVTTRCLASMTDRKRLLNEAFDAAGVGEEARMVVLRDSGGGSSGTTPVQQQQQRHTSNNGVTFSEGGDLTQYPHYSGYSPYGGGAGAATPFKPSTGTGGSSNSNPSEGVFTVRVPGGDGNNANNSSHSHNSNIASSSNINRSSSSSNSQQSVTDRFIAAILDGDVQGMQAVVRSQGEDLRSSYWRGAVHSVQPLHRAISGLQYHGSESLLLGMLKALVKIGADVNATDRVGNTPLHKAVLVCTSKNVLNAVSTLLVRGADPNAVNQAGDSPMHMECRRTRKASVYVVSALLEAGADPALQASASPGDASSSNSMVSPLTMTLLGGLAGTAPAEAAGNGGDSWVFAAHALVTACPQSAWDASWSETGSRRSQLHLLASLFPANKDCAGPYKSLFLHALKHGGFYGSGGGSGSAGVSPAAMAVAMCKLLERDSRGEEALFTLVRRMATVPACTANGSTLEDVRVGFPVELLTQMLQFMFVDGPEAATNSQRAARELLTSLVRCVERALDPNNSSLGGRIEPSSCLAHTERFLTSRGLRTTHSEGSSNNSTSNTNQKVVSKGALSANAAAVRGSSSSMSMHPRSLDVENFQDF